MMRDGRSRRAAKSLIRRLPWRQDNPKLRQFSREPVGHVKRVNERAVGSLIGDDAALIQGGDENEVLCPFDLK